MNAVQVRRHGTTAPVASGFVESPPVILTLLVLVFAVLVLRAAGPRDHKQRDLPVSLSAAAVR